MRGREQEINRRGHREHRGKASHAKTLRREEGRIFHHKGHKEHKGEEEGEEVR